MKRLLRKRGNRFTRGLLREVKGMQEFQTVRCRTCQKEMLHRLVLPGRFLSIHSIKEVPFYKREASSFLKNYKDRTARENATSYVTFSY